MIKRLWGAAWRDKWLLLVISVLITCAGFIIIPQQHWGILGPLVSRVETDDRVVALTFDDGPTQPQTEQLLRVLREEDVKATFYLIGVEMERHPAAAEAIAAAGHEIGNHSYTHNGLLFMGYTGEAREIEYTDSLIRSHDYSGPITIRPPFGYKLWELPLYAALHDREIVMWDVVLGNTPDNSVTDILRVAARDVRPGSIIIMHPMYDHNKRTLDAVEPLIKQLKLDGYRFVTMSELLELRL